LVIFGKINKSNNGILNSEKNVYTRFTDLFNEKIKHMTVYKKCPNNPQNIFNFASCHFIF